MGWQEDIAAVNKWILSTYEFTPNAVRCVQPGFFNGRDILFIGQNPGLKRGVPTDDAMYAAYEAKNYDELQRLYPVRLSEPDCLLGNFLKDIYGNEWGAISFTNAFKTPFRDNKLDIKDNTYYVSALEKQVQALQPLLIVAMGSVAGSILSQQQFVNYKKLRIPHYSYMLRDGSYDGKCKEFKLELQEALSEARKSCNQTLAKWD